MRNMMDEILSFGSPWSEFSMMIIVGISFLIIGLFCRFAFYVYENLKNKR
jgi:hypothetical protein